MNRVIKYNPNYEQKVKLLCERNEIAFPADGTFMFLSIDEHDNVNGIIGIKKVFFIEPMIAEHPMIAYELGKMIEGVIIAEGIEKVRCVVDKENDKHLAQLTKVGYEIINLSKITMEKYYG